MASARCTAGCTPGARTRSAFTWRGSSTRWWPMRCTAAGPHWGCNVRPLTATIGFAHLVTRAAIDVTCPPPADFARLAARHRGLIHPACSGAGGAFRAPSGLTGPHRYRPNPQAHRATPTPAVACHRAHWPVAAGPETRSIAAAGRPLCGCPLANRRPTCPAVTPCDRHRHSPSMTSAEAKRILETASSAPRPRMPLREMRLLFDDEIGPTRCACCSMNSPATGKTGASNSSPWPPAGAETGPNRGSTSTGCTREAAALFACGQRRRWPSWPIASRSHRGATSRTSAA